MKRVVWALVVLVGATAMTKAQDIAAGERAFRKCLPCHAVGPDARHKIGPVLNGLEGRKSGTIEGYNYSEANKKAAIVWNKETFADYIQNPMQRIPGTKMAFPGIKNAKEIADLWAYLAQFNADGSKK
jgi:cytochrome c